MGVLWIDLNVFYYIFKVSDEISFYEKVETQWKCGYICGGFLGLHLMESGPVDSLGKDNFIAWMSNWDYVFIFSKYSFA